MYLLEKIGQLVLITLEGHVTSYEVEEITRKLEKIIENEDEVVVSLSLASLDGEDIPVQEETKKSQQAIVTFCNEKDIRIYSYIL